jgi:hypothetical protein
MPRLSRASVEILGCIVRGQADPRTLSDSTGWTYERLIKWMARPGNQKLIRGFFAMRDLAAQAALLQYRDVAMQRLVDIANNSQSEVCAIRAAQTLLKMKIEPQAAGGSPRDDAAIGAKRCKTGTSTDKPPPPPEPTLAEFQAQRQEAMSKRLRRRSPVKDEQEDQLPEYVIDPELGRLPVKRRPKAAHLYPNGQIPGGPPLSDRWAGEPENAPKPEDQIRYEQQMEQARKDHPQAFPPDPDPSLYVDEEGNVTSGFFDIGENIDAWRKATAHIRRPRKTVVYD